MFRDCYGIDEFNQYTLYKQNSIFEGERIIQFYHHIYGITNLADTSLHLTCSDRVVLVYLLSIHLFITLYESRLTVRIKQACQPI